MHLGLLSELGLAYLLFDRGGLAPATASALVTAATVTVVVLPGVATWLLREPVTVSEP